MKIAMILGALAATLAPAASAAPAARIMGQPQYEQPARAWTDSTLPSEDVACRDRVTQARAATGQPAIESEYPASDEPLLHYAVDRRVDDCGVLVPVNDPTDLRLPPKPGKPEMRPARARN